MRPYEYLAPATVAEAVALLAEKAATARPMAGGTDLIVQMRAGRFDLDRVVDVKKIAELNQIQYDPGRGLTLGAAVPCCRILDEAAVCAAYPALAEAVAAIGGIAIQGRASVGGNLCNAASCANSAPPLMVVNATCRIAGPDGERTVPLESFFVGSGRTVLAPDELLVSIQAPPPAAGLGVRYLRFTPRAEMDIAVVGVAAAVVLAPGGQTIASSRIALSVVAATPVMAPRASASLAGKAVSDETIAAAAVLAREESHPRTSMRGTAAHRRQLVGVLVERALHDAVRRAKGERVDGR